MLVSARVSSVFQQPQPESGVYSYSGRGTSLRLPIADVLAVSPDGRHALGAAGPPDDFQERSRLRVVDVSSGRVAAELDLGSAGHPDLEGALGSGVAPGSWVGDTILVEAGVGEASALLVLRHSARLLVVEEVLKLTREVAEATGLRGPILLHFGQPVFVDSAAREFMVELTLLQVATAEERQTSLFLTCDRIDRHCRRGRAIEPPTRWAALVYNPSRP